MGTDKRERQKRLRQEKIEQLREQERKDERKGRAIWLGAAVAAFVVFALIFSIVTRDDGGDDEVETDDTATTEPDDGQDPGDSDADADGGDDGDSPDQAVAPPVPTVPVGDAVEPTCPAADGSADRTLDFTGPFENCLTDGVDYQARFTTSMGEVLVDLVEADTPNTVNNFVALARYHYYDDTLLFRTDPSIAIIQGGSPHTQNNADPGPGYTIEDEGEFDDSTGQLTGPYTYTEGQLIMARSAGPNSTGAQFFFSTGPEVALLDGQGTYLPVGDVIEGLGVLQAIIATHQDDPTSGLGGAPAEPVVLESVEIIER